MEELQKSTAQKGESLDVTTKKSLLQIEDKTILLQIFADYGDRMIFN